MSSVRTDDLAAIPVRASAERNASVKWEELDVALMGCANQAGEDNRNAAPMAIMLAGGVESMSRAPFVMGKADVAFFTWCRFI